MPTANTDRWLKPLVFILCSLPLMQLSAALLTGRLAPDPIQALTHGTGEWALRLLLLTLAMTPLKQLSGWRWPPRLRRLLGLFAFTYATAHLLIWAVLDQELRLAAVVDDIIQRPYITVGLLAFALLTPLAITSTNAMMRRLGGQRWKRLHRSVYLIGVLAVLHFLWLVKADAREPLVYGLILLLLLALRAPRRALARLRSPLK